MSAATFQIESEATTPTEKNYSSTAKGKLTVHILRTHHHLTKQE
jgi:hypothetical protein